MPHLGEKVRPKCSWADLVRYTKHLKHAAIELKVGFDQEQDGRWIADIPELPGVLVYGNSRDEAAAKAQALALRVMADEIEKKGAVDLDLHFTFS